ncbi:MAG: FkbM family methyltransferase [Desulfotignum sp.]|nr:FkbM family methyltransferase [Desulfotignum sp.]MCF8113029.1 FkbM family methyltransferase [Desulfotignum sp.]MCF8124784.1 FkbM family methyltransferase [Desulfotignum sp.]
MTKTVGPEGKVIAFEPQPELESHLLGLKSSFKLENLSIIRKGLSSKPGLLELYRSEPGSGGATLNKNQGPDTWQAVPVEVTTLDNYEDQLRDVGFIKCDVEGHEHDVFKGARNLLKRDKPCLLFECHHEEARKKNLFSYLISLGYDGFFPVMKEMIHFSRFDKFPYRRKNEHHRNYIFLHPEFIEKQGLEKQFFDQPV